jgi:dGTPase
MIYLGKEKYIILKYLKDHKKWNNLSQKLNTPLSQADKYYYNKCPLILEKNKEYNIIIAAISNQQANQIYFGNAEVHSSDKLIIENTYQLEEDKVELLREYYQKQANDNLFKISSKAKKTSKYIFIKELKKEAIDQILTKNIDFGPQIKTGEFQTLSPDLKKAAAINYLEKKLHPLAQRSKDAKRAIGLFKPDPNRSEFERDKDRIIHSRAFRRIVGKAQVYNTDKGDHYRTRMTHTLEVGQIAKSIARSLHLNQDLTEAIALAHDIGHTPFGHQGERQLDKAMRAKLNLAENDDSKLFKHNYQSLKVLNYLEEKYKENPGLDLSYQVYEGVLKHTNFKLCGDHKRKCSQCTQNCIEDFLIIGESKYLFLDYEFSTTLEGQIIYWADEIAQAEHDLDDGLSNGNIDLNKLNQELLIIIESYQNQSSQEKKQLQNLQKIVERYIDYDLGKYRSENEYISQPDIIKSEIVLKVTKFFIKEIITNSRANMDQYLKETDLKDSNFEENTPFIERPVIAFTQFENAANKDTNVLETFNNLISSQVLNSYEVNCFDGKSKYIIRKLFDAYFANPLQLPDNTLKRIDREIKRFDKSWKNIRSGNNKIVKKQLDICTNSSLKSSLRNDIDYIKRKIFVKTIIDFIAGMTDDFANSQFNKLYTP